MNLSINRSEPAASIDVLPQISSIGKNCSNAKPSNCDVSPGRSALNTNPTNKVGGGKRMESPDNDSAFCDNLSVLSSSNSNDAISANGSYNISQNFKVFNIEIYIPLNDKNIIELNSYINYYFGFFSE